MAKYYNKKLKRLVKDMKKGDLEAAEDYNRRCLDVASQVTESSALVANTLCDLGEIAMARRCAQRGLDIDPLDPFANFIMGRSFNRKTSAYPVIGLTMIKVISTHGNRYAGSI